MYVKKYNANINICKGFSLNYLKINIFRPYCSDYVSIKCNTCQVKCNLFINIAS